jgi:LEA14-like dessication related protein
MRWLLPALVCLVACRSTGGTPELRVLGVNDTQVHEVVFVQVTNPASQPLKLTKLEYTFAADGATLSTGEVPLEREIAAGAAVVVEVPLDTAGDKATSLQGTLTGEIDQIVHTYPVEAQIAPH